MKSSDRYGSALSYNISIYIYICVKSVKTVCVEFKGLFSAFFVVFKSFFFFFRRK